MVTFKSQFQHDPPPILALFCTKCFGYRLKSVFFFSRITVIYIFYSVYVKDYLKKRKLWIIIKAFRLVYFVPPCTLFSVRVQYSTVQYRH